MEVTQAWGGIVLFSSRSWWVLDPGLPWEQWARLAPNGMVMFYDAYGKPIVRTNYGSRSKAASSLKLRRFRRLREREVKALNPPGSKQPDDSDENSATA